MRSFNELKRNIKKDRTNLRTVKVALLTDNSSQLLAQCMIGYGFEVGYKIDLFESDYNQIDLQIFDYNSNLYTFQPELICINFSSEHFLAEFLKLNPEQACSFAHSKINHIIELCNRFSNKLNSKILFNTLGEINDSVYGQYSNKLKHSFVYQIRLFNLMLMDFSRENNNVHIYDIASIQMNLGYKFIFNPKLYINSDLIYDIDFLPYVAKSIVDILKAVKGEIKKCIILDLDNTLWGGIIGEDGIEGIHLGNFGIGKAFTNFQLWLKSLKNRGIILAVCSKNDEMIAKEPFLNHPDMVLTMSDIALFVANWENKVDNIAYIKSVLNIGYDSMVFFDDNPFEREIVRSSITDIQVPELPQDPSEYLPFLRDLNLFEVASISQEDASRTLQYQEESQRMAIKQQFLNENDFLDSLDMKSMVEEINQFSIPRVAQLSQRSNQFNLRTIRYSELELLDIIKSDDYFAFTFQLDDRFGGHGLISAVILKKHESNSLFIESWFMSCRVLKRSMEQFIMNFICDFCRKHEINTIIGEYIPTPKNGLVKNIYLDLGFSNFNNQFKLDIFSSETLLTSIRKV